MHNLGRNNATGFAISITAFDGSRFSGTVEDNEENGGTPGMGVINGTIQDNRIEFIKEMPVRTSCLTTGRRIEEHGKKHPIYPRINTSTLGS